MWPHCLYCKIAIFWRAHVATIKPCICIVWSYRLVETGMAKIISRKTIATCCRSFSRPDLNASLPSSLFPWNCCKKVYTGFSPSGNYSGKTGLLWHRLISIAMLSSCVGVLLLSWISKSSMFSLPPRFSHLEANKARIWNRNTACVKVVLDAVTAGPNLCPGTPALTKAHSSKVLLASVPYFA